MPTYIYLTYQATTTPPNQVIVEPLKVKYCQDAADDRDVEFVNLSTGKTLQVIFTEPASRNAFTPPLRHAKDDIVLEPIGSQSGKNRRSLKLRNKLGIEKRSGGCNFTAGVEQFEPHRYGINYIVRDITVLGGETLDKIPGGGSDPDIVVEC